MSVEQTPPQRWSIDPKPTAAEFVAILSAMQASIEATLHADEAPESRWAKTARREQMRTSLDDSGEEWNR